MEVVTKIVNHTQLLQALIDKYSLKSYLEIGVKNPCNNYDKIKCDYKDGCDPDLSQPDARNGATIARMSSDEFFERGYQIKPGYDLIFIDGDHTEEQVKRDFENSLRCLSDNGFILIHDCLPEKEETTVVPRQTKVWHGSVYKFAMSIRDNYDGVKFKTFNIDEGCMLCWKDNEATKAVFNLKVYDWEMYLKWRKELMNVVDNVEI